MTDKEQIAKDENKTMLIGIAVITVLEFAAWMFFYWIHLKIKGQ